MYATATRNDFNALSLEQQRKYSDLIFYCKDNSLPCRCEMVGGKEFSVVIAPGLPLASHWINRLDLDEG